MTLDRLVFGLRGAVGVLAVLFLGLLVHVSARAAEWEPWLTVTAEADVTIPVREGVTAWQMRVTFHEQYCNYDAYPMVDCPEPVQRVDESVFVSAGSAFWVTPTSYVLPGVVNFEGPIQTGSLPQVYELSPLYADPPEPPASAASGAEPLSSESSGLVMILGGCVVLAVFGGMGAARWLV